MSSFDETNTTTSVEVRDVTDNDDDQPEWTLNVPSASALNNGLADADAEDQASRKRELEVDREGVLASQRSRVEQAFRDRDAGSNKITFTSRHKLLSEIEDRLYKAGYDISQKQSYTLGDPSTSRDYTVTLTACVKKPSKDDDDLRLGQMLMRMKLMGVEDPISGLIGAPPNRPVNRGLFGGGPPPRCRSYPSSGSTRTFSIPLSHLLGGVPPSGQSPGKFWCKYSQSWEPIPTGGSPRAHSRAEALLSFLSMIADE